MRFSIIIPIHATEERKLFYHDIITLEGSILCQTFEDYEIIYVLDKCDEWAKKEFKYATYLSDAGNKKVIECEHGNAGLARNEGLEVAEGEYILFADDDDYILHEFVFEYIEKMLQAHSEPDVAHFGFIFGSNGYVYPTWNDGHLYGNVWSKAYKRSAIGDTRFPNVYPDDDLQFNKLMEQKDLRHVLCDAPIYYYNWMREGSITWKENQKK